MSTGPKREDAKQGVVAQDTKDPELDNALSEGQKLRLELTRETNRHARDMRDADLGALGKFFGDGKHVPTLAAGLAALAGVLVAISCLIAAAYQPEVAEFWAKQSERAFAFAAGALAFIFGANSQK